MQFLLGGPPVDLSSEHAERIARRRQGYPAVGKRILLAIDVELQASARAGARRCDRGRVRYLVPQQLVEVRPEVNEARRLQLFISAGSNPPDRLVRSGHVIIATGEMSDE